MAPRPLAPPPPAPGRGLWLQSALGVGLFGMVLAASLAVVEPGRRAAGPRAPLERADPRDAAQELALESVAALAAETLWSRYVAELGGAAGDLAGFRRHLEARDFPDAGPGPAPAPAQGRDVALALGLPVRGGRARLGELELSAVRVVRRDAPAETRLYVTVASARPERVLQQAYAVGPEEFPGLDFALLASDLDCVLCHARVDSAERRWNASSDAVGSFARVRVGALQSLRVRRGGADVLADDDADSSIAGTLYLGGRAGEASGAPLLDWAAQSLRRHPFDARTGRLLEDSSGLALAPFEPAADPPAPRASLYLDYPLGARDAVDGPLPARFPAPFPDDGGLAAAGAGNGRVDDGEFLAVARAARGTLRAASVHVVAPGAALDTAAELEAALGAASRPGELRGDGRGVRGHVVLLGTAAQPIRIEGALAIDGDLLVQGVVQGSGALWVRGNLYLPSDLEYADGRALRAGDARGQPSGARTFGLAADGTRNALALVAGGNVLIGDFRAAAGAPAGVSGHPDGGWNFALAMLARFNRAEWARTQATLPGPDGRARANPGYVPGHVPRYYAFAPGAPVPFLAGPSWFEPKTRIWHGPETAHGWDPALLELARPGDARLSGAVLRVLTPTGDWLAPALHARAQARLAAAREAGTPLRIDALVYTPNALIGVVPRASTFAGMLRWNGALLAADAGLLAPGRRDLVNRHAAHSALPGSRYALGLELNHDARPARDLRLVDARRVRLERLPWGPGEGLQ